MVLDLKTFAHKRCRIIAAKKVFTDSFFICSLCLNVFLSPLLTVKCPSFLDFRNPWEKSNKSGLGFVNFCLYRVLNRRPQETWFSDDFFCYRCYYQEMLCLPAVLLTVKRICRCCSNRHLFRAVFYSEFQFISA